jgi:hypothetical protein
MCRFRSDPDAMPATVMIEPIRLSVNGGAALHFPFMATS